MNKRIFKAPGRVEIGGNHTDHQRGRVLTAAVNLEMTAVVSALDDRYVCINSEGYPPVNIDLNDLSKRDDEKNTTAALVRGVASWFNNAGYKIGGFECSVTSNIPAGAGLSSSAAFEVLIANIFKGLYGADITATQIAICGKYAENEFFGKPCGLMDQMASSVGGMMMIDFLDLNNPVITPVKADMDEYALCITETGDDHEDLTADYASITSEMRLIAEHFGHDVLRNAAPEKFYASIPELWKYGERAIVRAIHFFEENERVLRQVTALQSGDLSGFLRDVTQSGRYSTAYLQNIFSVSHPEKQKLTLALALSEKILENRGAFRVHGGGFGGTVLAFVPAGKQKPYKTQMEAVFGPGSCRFLEINREGGREVF